MTVPTQKDVEDSFVGTVTTVLPKAEALRVLLRNIVANLGSGTLTAPVSVEVLDNVTASFDSIGVVMEDFYASTFLTFHAKNVNAPDTLKEIASIQFGTYYDDDGNITSPVVSILNSVLGSYPFNLFLDTDNLVIGTDTDDGENRFQVSGNTKLTGNLEVTGSINGGEFRSATVTLTAADLAVLDSVPFELVAAPGAGSAVAPNNFVIVVADNALGTDVSLILQWNGGGNLLYNGNTSVGGDTTDRMILLPNTDNPFDSAHFLVSQIENSAFEASTSSIDVPGAIATSSLNDGGAGYVNGDTFTVDTGLGTLATATVTNAIAGVVQPGGYTLDTAPNGYLVGTGVATIATSGVGTGLLIDIDTLDYTANPMTMTVKTIYSVMDVPA